MSYAEKVGSQFLSLRQSGYSKLSLTRFDDAKNPSIDGLFKRTPALCAASQSPKFSLSATTL